MSEISGTHKLCNSCINKIVEVLNRALDADHNAIRSLMKNKIFCNEKLASDPTIQAWVDENGTAITAMGLINGIVGTDNHGVGLIAYVEERDKTISSFIRFSIDCEKPPAAEATEGSEDGEK